MTSLVFFQKNLFSQNTSQVVKLTVTSQGSSQEEAKNNALRNVIQQTIGVFISANSTILNDNLVKDEIVSISNGTIQKYQILDEGELSNGIYFVTLNAEVSVTKLNSFIENKGVISGEHGIGRIHKERFVRKSQPFQKEIYTALKQQLDPNNRFPSLF